MRLLSIGAALLAMVACQPGAAQAQRPSCADRVAQALASPHAAVAGAYGCFDAEQMATLSTAGVNSDHDLVKLAATPPVSSVAVFEFMTADHGYVYRLEGPTSQVLVLWLDNRGLVAGVLVGGNPATRAR